MLVSPDGQPFHAVLNGQRVTETPVTSVRLPGLTDPAYKLRVQFADPSLGDESLSLSLISAASVSPLGPGRELSTSVPQNQTPGCDACPGVSHRLIFTESPRVPSHQKATTLSGVKSSPGRATGTTNGLASMGQNICPPSG